MRVVVAPDSFKGTCPAHEVADLLARGLGEAGIEAAIHPLADGGEGMMDAVLRACPEGCRIEHEVAGPAPGQRVRAAFAWFPRRRWALVETAAASGLTLLPPGRRDPTRTTTFGTGELLHAAALRIGSAESPSSPVPSLLLGLGGSATVDGGTGMAQALGWRFLDFRGRDLLPGGGDLIRLDRIIPPEHPVALPAVEILCDVDHPLTGPEGAAAVFGPQKGATPPQVEILDRSLTRLAEVMEASGHPGIRSRPGGGAAGGLGAGAVAFLGGRMVPGVYRLLEVTGFGEALDGADLVVTGEGCFDATSLRGKVVSGVMAAAGRRGIPVAVVAGQARIPRPDGVAHLVSLLREGEALESAMRETRLRLKEAGRMLGVWLKNLPN